MTLWPRFLFPHKIAEIIVLKGLERNKTATMLITTSANQCNEKAYKSAIVGNTNPEIMGIAPNTGL